MVASILDIQTVGFEEKYLGLQGRMKDGQFQPIKEKIKKSFFDYVSSTMASFHVIFKTTERLKRWKRDA